MTGSFGNYGWRMDLEDHENLEARAMTFTAPVFDAPASVDHRGWLHVEHQGRLSTCTGHAMSTCLEICEYIDTQGNQVQLNRMFSYITGQQLAGLAGRDQGCTIYGVVEAAKGSGICPESAWPYSGAYTTKIPKSATQIASQHRLKNHTRLRSYDELFAFLAAGQGAAIIGIPWRSDHANAGKILSKNGGRRLGGHALALSGYTEEKDGGRNRIIMSNSHGNGWGDGGHTEVVADLIDAWFDDNYTDVFGVSDLEEFGEIRKPRITALI